MTTLVTIGCSHTAGAMLDGRNGTSWKNKELSFGGLLAKKYNMSHYCLGVPGGSNEYIYKSTIKFINNFMHDHDDYIFLLGWTSSHRMELRYPESSRHIHKVVGDFLDQKHIPFTSGTNPDLYHTREVKTLRKYAPLIFYGRQLETDWAMYAYTLQNLFANKGLKYYMHNTCFQLERQTRNRVIVDALDDRYYFNPTDKDSSMLYYAFDKGYKRTDCWHLYPDGHEMWANKLDELMSAQGLFNNLKQPPVKSKDDCVRAGGKYITHKDMDEILSRYKISARYHLDSMYDRIYIQFNDKEKEYSANIKINIINKEIVRRYGPTSKISKYCIGFYQMDDTFMLEHFRKMT